LERERETCLFRHLENLNKALIEMEGTTI